MKYHIINNGQKIELGNADLKTCYFLEGYQSKADKGKLYKRTIKGLLPVLNETGITPCYPEYAGKEVRETNFLNL